MAEASRRPLEVAYHGLRTKPFRENTDPAFLWLGLPYRDALNKLRNGVLQNAGVLLLTGEIGVGKTMLARALGDRLSGDGVRVAKIGHAPAHPDEFRNGVARAFGSPAPQSAQDSFASGFAEFLRAAHALGDRALLIIDEAQSLDAALLDAVADLVRVGREASGGTVNVLNVLLVAQPGIEPVLKRRKRHDGEDFVTVRAHLGRLDVAQVGDYVAFRLRAAGADREIFSYDAIGEVATMSGGVPRLINQICDRTLLATSAWNGCMVSAGVVRGALRDGDPVVVSGGRRWLPSFGSRRVVYTAAGVVLVLGLGLGAYLYHEGVPTTVLDRRARDAGTKDAASSTAVPAAPSASDSTSAPAPPVASTPAVSEGPRRATGDDVAPRTTGSATATPEAPGASRATTEATSASRSATTEATSPSGTVASSPAPPAPAAPAPPMSGAVNGRAAARGADLPPRAITMPPAPRPDAGRIETVPVVKPRPTPVMPARAPVPDPSPGRASDPGPAVSRPPAPVVTPPVPTAPRDSTPEPAPPARPGRESSDAPTAIIDWLLQRNPAAGR